MSNRNPTPAAIARLIDHALLHPTLSDAELVAGCELAARLDLMSVCVKPYGIPLAVKTLAGTRTATGTVIGFPHGHVPTAIKVAEANWSLDAGAVELDMVVNIGKVFSGDWQYVAADIRAVVDTGHARRAIVKVILETDLVTDQGWKRRLCEICTDAGADFVKTSTGFGFVRQKTGGYDYRGATVDDVRLMRAASGPAVGVKASGGVRDWSQAVEFVRLGATRLGTSASEAILKAGAADESGY
jgi:deoxyribose-phosphate aldolase